MLSGPEELKAILAQPDCSTSEGQRDHVLLSFLYNTGARIQEALEVRPQAIRFDSPACVRPARAGKNGCARCRQKRFRCSEHC
jgi:site-specific recombinase XerD